ncbi:MAG: hypothetical protein J7L96_02295 [Bacteroidales bacterium]|nr:hypothetical protein [Bacteroidales bacterium]
MELGTNINLPGIRGAEDLIYTLSEPTTARQIKIYLVPETVSADRYFITIKQSGAVEVIPPCRSKDTILLADYSQDTDDNVIVNYVNKEVQNA